MVFTVSEHMVQTLSLLCLSLFTAVADFSPSDLCVGAAVLVLLETVLLPEVLVDMLGLGLDLLWSLVGESLTKIWGYRL